MSGGKRSVKDFFNPLPKRLATNSDSRAAPEQLFEPSAHTHNVEEKNKIENDQEDDDFVLSST